MRRSLYISSSLVAAVTALAGPACTASNDTRLPQNASYPDGGALRLPCLPNLDGQIDAAELHPATGVAATFLVSPPGTTRPVDLVGRVDAAGKRIWDWSAGAAQDLQASLTATPLQGKWYAASFPAGQFTTPIDAAGTTEGIASKDENPAEGKTLLVYHAPVAVLQFPIKPGAAWTSVGDSTNVIIRGFPDATHDTYDVKVDAVGTLVLPEFTLTQVMRVRTTATVTPSVGVTTSTRQASFLFECFGEVARATSKVNEPNEDFDTAAEIRRLGATPQ